MGESFTPDLEKLLKAAGCRFVRPGKGDHKHLVLSKYWDLFSGRFQDQVSSHGKCRLEAGWTEEALLNTQHLHRSISCTADYTAICTFGTLGF